MVTYFLVGLKIYFVLLGAVDAVFSPDIRVSQMRLVKEERSLYLGKQNQKKKRRKRRKNYKALSVHVVSLTVYKNLFFTHFSRAAVHNNVRNVSSDSRNLTHVHGL